MTPALSTMDATTTDKIARRTVESDPANHKIEMKFTIENGNWCRRPFVRMNGPNGLSDKPLTEQAGERTEQ